MKIIFTSLLFIVSFHLYAETTSTSTLHPKDFAQLPKISDIILSPDGQSVAYIALHDGQPMIFTKALAKKSNISPGVIALDGAQLYWMHWVNNEKLLVALIISAEHNRAGNLKYIRTFSIDRSGSNPVYFKMGRNKYGYALNNPKLIHLLPDDPQHVLMTLDPIDSKWMRPQVHKVNVYTGEKTLVEANRGEYHYFLSDSKGNIKVAGKFGLGSGTDIAIYIKKTPKSSWALLQKKNFLSQQRLTPLRLDYARDDILLMSSETIRDSKQVNNENIYAYDIKTNKWLGQYENKIYEHAKKAVEKAFPHHNVLLESAANNATLDIATYKIYSDISPPRFFILNIAQKRLDFLAAQYPNLQDKAWAAMQKTHYTARDGLNIPAYFTYPLKQHKSKAKGSKIPAIIYPHGGPWGSDKWEFNLYVQFFAYNGYAVLQPQFRGSTGFGYDHLQAGFKQWGLKMQDDISDGVAWLIKNKNVDPNRICIVGSSYGGYAAAMGLATTPALYQCGISINGILDMKKFASNELRYNEYNRKIINTSWNMNKISPYHLAQDINDPLLIIYSKNDSVVKPLHSIKMHKKLKKLKKDSTLTLLPSGEHWPSNPKDEVIKFEAMDTFLKRHLHHSAAQ